MGSVTYRDGIAILQLLVFPFILVAALFTWHRTGWRVGSKIWRFPVTLSLIRIAGSICSLLTINNDSTNIEIAVAVCELIGLAPLLLTYIGLLRQIDTEPKINPRVMKWVAIVPIIGLILGIAGISSASDDQGNYHSNGMVKGSMGIFIAVYVSIVLTTAWLFLQLHSTLMSFQRKLFLAIAISLPLLLIRLIYSAMADYTTDVRFAVLFGDTTIYLCMNVLEEIVALIVTMAFGVSAVTEQHKTKLVETEMAYEPCRYQE